MMGFCFQHAHGIRERVFGHLSCLGYDTSLLTFSATSLKHYTLLAILSLRQWQLVFALEQAVVEGLVPIAGACD
jgi:hypothetical protein